MAQYLQINYCYESAEKPSIAIEKTDPSSKFSFEDQLLEMEQPWRSSLYDAVMSLDEVAARQCLADIAPTLSSLHQHLEQLLDELRLDKIAMLLQTVSDREMVPLEVSPSG